MHYCLHLSLVVLVSYVVGSIFLDSAFQRIFSFSCTFTFNFTFIVSEIVRTKLFRSVFFCLKLWFRSTNSLVTFIFVGESKEKKKRWDGSDLTFYGSEFVWQIRYQVEWCDSPRELMRILKMAKYRLKAQVEKDEGPSGEGRRPKWRRTKPPSGEGWRPKWRKMKAQRQRHYQDY